MKKFTVISFLLSSVILFAQTTYVPDDNFEQALIDLGYDDVLDDYVLTDNIDDVDNLNVSNKAIQDLTGIEGFTLLEYLYCHNNQLSSLDVSQNLSLFHLNCNANQISTLDVSQNTALVNLYCYTNQLTTLDVSQNPDLYNLWCHDNQLAELDVSQNLALGRFACDENQISSLDVSQNADLIYLNCSFNPITSLDLNQNIALEELNILETQTSELDLTQNTALDTLFAFDNDQDGYLGVLDLSQCSSLEYAYCYGNQISEIDVSSSTNLIDLWCFSNQITVLNVSNNTALENLICTWNQITSLDISNNPNLVFFNAAENQLTTLDARNGNNTNMVGDDFNAQLNPNLTCIFVDDAAWSTANWIDIDPNSTFVETQLECDALAVDEVFLPEGLQAYPNPTTNQLFINNSNNLNIQSVRLYDVLGKQIIKEHNTFQQIDVSTLKSGVYLVKIETDRGVLTKKVVKD